MPLFSSNKHNQNDGTLNGNNGANTGSTMRQNEYDQEPNRSDYAYDNNNNNNNNTSSGTGPRAGGMYNDERGQGMNQGYNDTGNEFGETRAERRAERAEEMPMGGQTGGHHHHHHGAGMNPSANPETGVGAGTYGGTGAGTGGGGGFISQSHSDQLGRDAEVRRQERGNEFGRGGAGNTDEYNAMGFDSPPSNSNTNNRGGGGFVSQSHADRLGRDADVRRQERGNEFGRGGAGNTAEYNAMGFDSPPSNTNNNNNNMTSPTGTGTGTGSIPHNSMSLKEQAEQKARESESMQKQAIEVGKAEELEKQALAARQRAVEHGAHPLHGQTGGLQGISGRGGNQA